jgi:spermidine/putrescine transport system permease protein
MKLYRTFVQPYLFWMSIFIVVPMLLIVFYAFTTSGNNIISFRFTLDNFLRFGEPIFLRVLLRSLSIAMITTLISIIIGYPVAYLISQTNEKIQTLLILLVTIPMWINMLVRTYAWIGILSENGLINSFLSWAGLPTVNLMYTNFAVILGMVYNFLPFMILSIYTVLAKLDKALIQASYDLGANKTQTFLKIVLPLSVPGIISGITLVFLPAVSTFVIPRFLGGGNFVLIGNLIETQFITVGEWNFGSAISMIMASVIMMTMFITKRFDQDIEEIQTRKEVG